MTLTSESSHYVVHGRSGRRKSITMSLPASTRRLESFRHHIKRVLNKELTSNREVRLIETELS